MKFDVAVGNPPYQESKEGGKDLPLYPLFYELAENISDKYMLISPARFLFGAGATKSEWNEKMLSDEHVKVVYFNQKSAKVFPNTDIKGGVAIIYRDSNKKFGAIETFTPFEELRNILQKVESISTSSIGDILHGVTSYTFMPKIYKEYPNIAKRVGKGSGNQLTSGIFDAAPEVFSDSKKNDSQIAIYGLQNNKRVYKWINQEYLQTPKNLGKYKVFIPAANGSGILGERLATLVVGNPSVGHTATFISIGSLDTEIEAENLLKYIKSKFARIMLGVKKITQHSKTKEVWSKVPLQDFSIESDIDWSTSIHDIDQQLYKKYQLSQLEIEFIESKAKEMT